MQTGKLLKYVLFDVLRSKIIIFYALILFIASFSVIYLGSDSSKATVSLLNIVLIIVPLISIIFGTVYFYNMREFRELLLAQPVSREKIFMGEYLGLASSLALGFMAGAGIPVLFFGVSEGTVYLLITGTLLTFVFVGLSYLASVITNDKVKGIGLALFIWFYMSILFDGIVLLLMFLLEDYPVEKLVLVLNSLNPVDLGRVLILLKLDISVLLGYTGALYKSFFSSGIGIVLSLVLMVLWIIVPTFIAQKIFVKKDF